MKPTQANRAAKKEDGNPPAPGTEQVHVRGEMDAAATASGARGDEDPYAEVDFSSPSALLVMAAMGFDIEAHLMATANEGLEDLSAYHHISPTGVAAAGLYASGLYDREDEAEEES